MLFAGSFSLGNYFFYSQQSMLASTESPSVEKVYDYVPPRQIFDFPIALYLGLALVGAAVLGIILYIREKSKFNVRSREEFL
jgi:hypothetical protein